MVKGRRKNLTNRNQDHSPSSEPSTPTSASPGYHNTPEKLDPDLKAYIMMMVEDIKKDFNNSLKEIQENTVKQVKELNKVIQNLKVGVETIKKTQMEANLEMENLGKRSGFIDVSITNRIQEIEERISGVEDKVEEIDTTVKENSKPK